MALLPISQLSDPGTWVLREYWSSVPPPTTPFTPTIRPWQKGQWSAADWPSTTANILLEDWVDLPIKGLAQIGIISSCIVGYLWSLIGDTVNHGINGFYDWTL